jgi:hypothetical protein
MTREIKSRKQKEKGYELGYLQGYQPATQERKDNTNEHRRVTQSGSTRLIFVYFSAI